MKVVNYNYQHTIIHKLCKSMLMKNHCKIITSDKGKGIIHAESKFRFWYPVFTIHIQSEELNTNQTKLTIDFIPKNTNKRSITIQEREEMKFLEMVNYYL